MDKYTHSQIWAGKWRTRDRLKSYHPHEYMISFARSPDAFSNTPGTDAVPRDWHVPISIHGMISPPSPMDPQSSWLLIRQLSKTCWLFAVHMRKGLVPGFQHAPGLVTVTLQLGQTVARLERKSHWLSGHWRRKDWRRTLWHSVIICPLEGFHPVAPLWAKALQHPIDPHLVLGHHETCAPFTKLVPLFVRPILKDIRITWHNGKESQRMPRKFCEHRKMQRAWRLRATYVVFAEG